MPIRALLRPLAAGVLIVASAGAVAANASARQTAVAFAESTMPTWTQAAQTMPQERPLVAQFFADSRGEQAARIRAQMERMEARARADDRLNDRTQRRHAHRNRRILLQSRRLVAHAVEQVSQHQHECRGPDQTEDKPHMAVERE